MLLRLPLLPFPCKERDSVLTVSALRVRRVVKGWVSQYGTGYEIPRSLRARSAEKRGFAQERIPRPSNQRDGGDAYGDLPEGRACAWWSGHVIRSGCPPLTHIRSTDSAWAEAYAEVLPHSADSIEVLTRGFAPCATPTSPARGSGRALLPSLGSVICRVKAELSKSTTKHSTNE